MGDLKRLIWTRDLWITQMNDFPILLGIMLVLTFCVLLLCVYLETRINKLQDLVVELKVKLERLENASK